MSEIVNKNITIVFQFIYSYILKQTEKILEDFWGPSPTGKHNTLNKF